MIDFLKGFHYYSLVKNFTYYRIEEKTETFYDREGDK
jgi:hypothetical protein